MGTDVSWFVLSSALCHTPWECFRSVVIFSGSVREKRATLLPEEVRDQGTHDSSGVK